MVDSHSSELRINHRLFFWIPDFVRKVLKIFQIFFKPSGPFGKPNQPVHLVQFAGTVVWVVLFVCVGSWLFDVGIEIRLSCWISEFERKVLEIFEIFCQPSGPVGKQNQPVHLVQFAGTAVWVV